MATTINNQRKKGDLIASQVFAQVFQAYLECSDEVQEAIRDMVTIVNAPDSTKEECDAAHATIADALFPNMHNGELGIDLEEAEKSASMEVRTLLKQMDQEEATFAEKLEALLEAKEMTQGDLANAIGVGQPAISMMLQRNCRPQRRTVEKIAQALQVSPEDIWPDIKDD